MRKTNGSFVFNWSFEKLDFFPITYQTYLPYNINSEEILNYKR